MSSSQNESGMLMLLYVQIQENYFWGAPFIHSHFCFKWCQPNHELKYHPWSPQKWQVFSTIGLLMCTSLIYSMTCFCRSAYLYASPSCLCLCGCNLSKLPSYLNRSFISYLVVLFLLRIFLAGLWLLTLEQHSFDHNEAISTKLLLDGVHSVFVSFRKGRAEKKPEMKTLRSSYLSLFSIV